MKGLFLSLLLMFIVGLLFAQENPENVQYYNDGYITNDIVNKQFCYVSGGTEGQVRWTLGDSNPINAKPVKDKKALAILCHY